MSLAKAKLSRWSFAISILLLQFTMYLTMLVDLPVARQVIGFVYLTFLPGFVIVKLLKLNELDGVETILFSIGLSSAFLMLVGLSMNELSFLFTDLRPLSPVPLTIGLNSIILLGAILVNSRSEHTVLRGGLTRGISPSALFLLCFPIMSVLGAMWVNAYGSNWILLFLIVTISLLFVIGVTSKKLVPSKLYPVLVFILAVSLLYHSSLISKYIVTFGSDVAVEYFVFKTTQDAALWSSTNPYAGSLAVAYGRFSSMLSVTILPTVYSSLLNMDSAWMFKIVYPLFLVFATVSLYKVWSRFFGAKYAFISAFLLMAQETFFTEMLGLNRQMVAELFFALLLLAILKTDIKSSKRMICFMIFSVGLVVSHYAISEIFLFFFALTLISQLLVKRLSRNITAGMLVFFFAVMFTWYIYTSGSAVFESFIEFGDYVYNQLGEFTNPASRGETVLRGLGLEPPPTIWNAISRGFAYLIQFLIVLGFVGLIMKRIRSDFDRGYFTFTSVAVGFLVALIVVPGLAETLNMTRFYHILLFFLAPLCVTGAEFATKLLFRREKEIIVSVLMLIVLVPYFLFQTNFIYEITGSGSWSVPLSSYRMNRYQLYYGSGYTDDWNVFAAEWIKRNRPIQSVQLYGDFSSRTTLMIYGNVYSGNIVTLSNVTDVSADGIVYLNSLNIHNRTIVAGKYVLTLDDLSFLDDTNKIYTNGGSEIFQKP